MYRGSAGGEVALLIRRVLHKLGIGRDRVQFILTSASVPSDDTPIYKFACELSAQNEKANNFKIIRGKEEPIEFTASEINARDLLDFDIDALQGDWDTKKEAIADFARRIEFDMDCDHDDEKSVEVWLYKCLFNTNPMRRIMQATRGNAMSFNQLALKAFPSDEAETAQKATSAFLAIGSDYKIESHERQHFLTENGISHKIMVLPAMWIKHYSEIPLNVITVSDKLLKYALPKADAIIRKQL